MPAGVYNLTRQTSLGARLRVARNFYWRARGLIGRDFSRFDAIAFPACNGVHTCFMGRPIDVLFLDEAARVVGLRAALRPWRFATCRAATRVVELPAGVAAATGTAVGDELHLEEMAP